MKSVYLASTEDTEELGKWLFDQLSSPCVIYLQGDLGAGKTTFARGFVRAAGFSGPVKSPTYTLVEPYESECLTLLHLDLFRMADPAEFEYLGVLDQLSDNTILLIEWPSMGEGWLPEADVLVELKQHEQGRLAIIETMDTRISLGK